MLDVYLSEEYNHHWPEIVKSAQSEEKSKSKLRGYAVEGYRLSENGFGLARCCAAQDTTIQEGSTTWNIECGDEVFVNLVLPHTSLADIDRCKPRSRCMSRSR